MYVSWTLHDVPTNRENRFQRFSNSGTYRVTHRSIVECATCTPRSAIISTRSRYDSRYVMYPRTHNSMMSASKAPWRRRLIRLHSWGDSHVGFTSERWPHHRQSCWLARGVYSPARAADRSEERRG